MESFPRPALHLRQELERCQAQFEHQPPMIQRYLENQARVLAEGVVAGVRRISFTLPDQIFLPANDGHAGALAVPIHHRQQTIGGVTSALRRLDTRQALQQRLAYLEHAQNQALATAAELLRYAAASHLVLNMLPDGRFVRYRPNGDEVMPSIPADNHEPGSAITQASDAITLAETSENGRGELQVPFHPAERKFYLPQWVAFDENARLLTSSVQEAEACVLSMQRYVSVLHRASALAPYIVACDDYQRKRYGILGQLLNQGRTLATYKTREIIREIRERATRQSLNRGLSISMPYFDDQRLAMSALDFVVIPAGRIMFIPAFVVRAARDEQAKVGQDTRLNGSTRKHLLDQLKMLEYEFQA